MGYTHYFYLTRKPSAAKWNAFTSEVRVILSHPAVSSLVCREFDQPDDPPEITKHEVNFNGKGDAGYETFYLAPTPHEYRCKTGGPSQMDFSGSWGKSYDVAVCAVLLAAHHHFSASISISSDGNWDEASWMRARALYGRITSRIVRCPWPIKQCSQCGRSYSLKGHMWGGYDVCATPGCSSTSWSSIGYSDGKSHCCTCGKTARKRPKPLDWCYFCSNGYKNKQEAGEALAAKWETILAELKKLDLGKTLRTKPSRRQR